MKAALLRACEAQREEVASSLQTAEKKRSSCRLCCDGEAMGARWLPVLPLADGVLFEVVAENALSTM